MFEREIMRLPNFVFRKSSVQGTPRAAGERSREAIGAKEPLRIANPLGLRIAYNDEGPDSPDAGAARDVVVCLHAVGHGARDFEAFIERARTRYRVIALDWPGHGRSSDDQEPPSVARYSEVLAAFLDSIGVERATFIGNSIGGGAVIRFASEFPGRVRAMILENPAGLDPPDVIAKGAIAGMVRMFRAGEEGEAWFDAAFDAYYRAVLPSPRTSAAREQRTRIVAAGRESASLLRRAWESFAHPSQDLRGLGATISRPVLFAWATRDRFVQLWRSRPAILEYANARIEEFDAGHSPHLETPNEFFVSFERFMREVVELEAQEKM